MVAPSRPDTIDQVSDRRLVSDDLKIHSFGASGTLQPGERPYFYYQGSIERYSEG
jgi:hypothetical protein